MRIVIGTMIAMVLLAGCQSNTASTADHGELPPGTVSHVVVCWLNDPGNAEQRQRVVDRSKDFRSIPGVVSISAGTPLPSTRPVVDSSFDVAIVIRFRDEAALRAYDTNRIHQQAVREVLKPLVKKLLIYDALDH